MSTDNISIQIREYLTISKQCVDPEIKQCTASADDAVQYQVPETVEQSKHLVFHMVCCFIL